MENDAILEKIKRIEYNTRSSRRADYMKRRIAIVAAFYPRYQEYSYGGLLEKLYEIGLSTHEIAEKIQRECGETISARSVERELKRCGCELRCVGESFRNAMKRGRVKWQKNKEV